MLSLEDNYAVPLRVVIKIEISCRGLGDGEKWKNSCGTLVLSVVTDRIKLIESTILDFKPTLSEGDFMFCEMCYHITEVCSARSCTVCSAHIRHLLERICSAASNPDDCLRAVDPRDACSSSLIAACHPHLKMV